MVDSEENDKFDLEVKRLNIQSCGTIQSRQ